MEKWALRKKLIFEKIETEKKDLERKIVELEKKLEELKTARDGDVGDDAEAESTK